MVLMQMGSGFNDKVEDGYEENVTGELFSEEDRDLIINRLLSLGLHTREMVRVTGASPRTVARILQKLGIQRKKPERFPSTRKRRAQRIVEILTQYYALKEVTLDSLVLLARQNGLSFRKLLNLIRENVTSSRWAMRLCLNCNQPALTSSPSDRYCPMCKKKVKKAREGLEDTAIYE
jgi:hypothetical protein